MSDESAGARAEEPRFEAPHPNGAGEHAPPARPHRRLGPVLGLLAWWLAPVLGEPDDGDETTPPLPTPPGGHILTLPGEEAAA